MNARSGHTWARGHALASNGRSLKESSNSSKKDESTKESLDADELESVEVPLFVRRRGENWQSAGISSKSSSSVVQSMPGGCVWVSNIHRFLGGAILREFFGEKGATELWSELNVANKP